MSLFTVLSLVLKTRKVIVSCFVGFDIPVLASGPTGLAITVLVLTLTYSHNDKWKANETAILTYC